jgi:hypothetical protein
VVSPEPLCARIGAAGVIPLLDGWCVIGKLGTGVAPDLAADDNDDPGIVYSCPSKVNSVGEALSRL